MALEFICSNEIIEGKKIALPRESFNRGALKYKIEWINRKKRKIKFFYADNSDADVFPLNKWTVPKGARKIEFSIYKEYGQNILQAPVFYDDQGEILKIGNR